MPKLRRRTRFEWVHTLKFKIVAMAVVASLGAALLTAQLVLATTEANMQALLFEGERDDAESMSALLSTKVDLLRNAIKASAQRMPARYWSQPDAMNAHLASRVALGTLFETLVAVDLQGNVVGRSGLGSSPQGDRLNIADRAYFQRALKTDQLVISEPIKAKRLETPVVVFAVASLSEDGVPVGVLAGVVALKSNSLFAERVAGSRADRARMVVMTREGDLLAHPNPDRILGNAGDEPGLAAAAGQWRDVGSPIDTLGTAALHQGQLVAMAGIPDTDWMLARVTPESVALAPIANAHRMARAVAVAVALIVAAAAGFLAWLLTRPISRLRARAERLLHADDTAASGWPDARGEVGELSAAFQRVVQQRHQKQIETQGLLVQIEAVLDHAEAGIALTRNGRFELVSNEFCALFGHAKADVVGQPTTLIHLSDAAYEAFSRQAHPAFMRDGSFETEVQLLRKGSEMFWARTRGKAVAPGDRSQGTIWTFDDITASRVTQQKLIYASTHDALTGLLNRSAFDDLLKRALEQRNRSSVTAMFIDLDRFKHVNDTGGHAAGDAMLRDVAQVVAAQVRQSDTVARLGGDEFAILLVGCPTEQAVEIGEKVRRAVEGYILPWQGETYSVGASIGLVMVNDSYGSSEEVLAAADAACYAAKHRGRNAVVVFSQ